MQIECDLIGLTKDLGDVLGVISKITCHTILYQDHCSCEGGSSFSQHESNVVGGSGHVSSGQNISTP